MKNVNTNMNINMNMKININMNINLNINIIININIDMNIDMKPVIRSLKHIPPLTFYHRNATDNSAKYDARVLIPYKGKIIPSNCKYNPNS